MLIRQGLASAVRTQACLLWRQLIELNRLNPLEVDLGSGREVQSHKLIVEAVTAGLCQLMCLGRG